MNGITHIFFDLDHTLWDYDANARETLTELFHAYDLGQYFSSPEAFINSFHYKNHQLWKRYNKGEIDRDFIRKHRFRSLLEERGTVSDTMNDSISEYFFTTCPRKTALIDGAIEVLEKLSKAYELGIITNGFEDTQSIKLTESGLDKYFKYVITSETAGHRKPSLEIFELALEISGADIESVIMIGDNYATDITGAQNAQWKSIWFNPNGDTDFEHENQVENLTDLLKHL